MREIRDVNRCSRCQTVIAALVHDRDVDEEGQLRELIHWLPRRAHTDDDCARQVALNVEEWPQLW
jgi:hypothetical protein